jgi:molybdopterin biosynthesis enzyme
MTADLDAPPRRYSVVDDQVNVGRRAVGPRLRVFLDGKAVGRVRGYDVERGEIVRIRTGADGKPMIDRALGVVQEETLRGTVTVEWRD